MEIAILILVGAIAWRGCNMVVLLVTERRLLEVPIFFAPGLPGYRIASVYMIAAPILAFLNGYLLNGFVGLLICGIGTWLAMLLFHFFWSTSFRRSGGTGARQFLFFGTVNVLWTIVNVFRAVG